VDTRTREARAREVLMLVNADMALEPPQPLPPAFKLVGHLLTRPAAPLPADLEARPRPESCTGLKTLPAARKCDQSFTTSAAC
jgi:hypothetical protein